MKILIVTEALNRKHGANGSLIDLLVALRGLGHNVYALTTARNFIIGWMEALLNVPISPLKILGCNARGLTDCFDIVFLIGSIGQDTLSMVKSDCPEAKLISFQTSNVVFDLSRRPFLESLDVLCFQSPQQYIEYSTVHAKGGFEQLPTPVLVGATCRENKILRSPVFGFQKAPVISIFGSIQPRKGQLEVAQIIERHVDVFRGSQVNFFGPLHSVAHAGYCQEFLQTIRRLLINGLSVKYWGHRSDYIRFLKGSDVVLSYSSEEGLSTIVRESLFLGKIIKCI